MVHILWIESNQVELWSLTSAIWCGFSFVQNLLAGIIACVWQTAFHVA